MADSSLLEYERDVEQSRARLTRDLPFFARRRLSQASRMI
jgi:hypothetical protein